MSDKIKYPALKLLIFQLLIISQISAQDISQQFDPQETALRQAMWSISAQSCQQHVDVLASEKFSGRRTGSEGFNDAANYIADHFAAIGLKPAFSNSGFFQKFYVTPNIIGSGSELALEILIQSKSSIDTLWINYQLETDFLPSGFSAPIDKLAQAVFVGYGLTSEKNDWDDYRGVDVKGKVVVVLHGTPPLENVDWNDAFRIRNKANNAKQHGAAAFISIGTPIGMFSAKQVIPGLVITERVANEFLKGSGLTIEKLKQQIAQRLKPVSFQFPNRMRLKINAVLEPETETMNIVGILPGSDAALSKECIVIGAHADHLGSIGTFTFYGANDNASGTAVVMAVAEAFSKLEIAPRRSIVFAAFSGEEMGLLGSRHYVQNPVFPIDRTKAMINLDMVGSGREGIMIVGGHTFPEFANMFEKYNESFGFTAIYRRWTSKNSDHWPFHEKGTPSVFLYTMGGLPTYHSTNDRPETLEAEVMEIVGRLAFRVIAELADLDKINFSAVSSD
ncbi:MAG: M28 family peptidase [bacterium]|nr:M28 family peptidase [bacterium]